MYYVISFYKFKQLTETKIKEVEDKLNQISEEDSWLGLVIMGVEGINATLANKDRAVLERFKDFLCKELDTTEIDFKESTATKKPFKRFKIKIRKEIVTIDRPDLVPNGDFNHLSPKEWHHELLSMDNDTVLIDTRNWYETKVGIFENAIDPKIEMFTEFKDYLKEAQISKDKKVLMYCTGGIRCEKASLLMADMGYEKVYQLKGGILKYMEEYPKGKFKGECFVFDHRVAVNEELSESAQFSLCPLCGNPGTEEITCCKCSSPGVVCKECLAEYPQIVCSKNCRHHLYEKSVNSKSNSFGISSNDSNTSL